MGQGEFFDCSHLGDRAFSIEYEYLETLGYGKDKSGSVKYLQGLLEVIQQVNDKGERIVPLHVDGDGHCLVHAISRALTGREIFWHALMTNLQKHLKDNLNKYKSLTNGGCCIAPNLLPRAVGVVHKISDFFQVVLTSFC